MLPVCCDVRASVPPPAYHRERRRLSPALHIDTLTLVTRLHLLALCRLAVQLAPWCAPTLPAGPGGRPRLYREESLLLLALLRTLWRLSYQDVPTGWWPGRPSHRRVACRLTRADNRACPVRRSNGNGPHGQVRRWLRHCSSSSLAWHGTTASPVPMISSSTAPPSWPGVAAIPMPRLVTPRPTIRVHSCAAIACTPSSVAVRAFPCSSCSRRQTPATRHSRVRCSNGPSASTGCVRM